MEQSKELRVERREGRMNWKVMISQAPVQLNWLVILLTFTQNFRYKLCLSEPKSYGISPWSLWQHDWLTWRHIREPWNASALHWCHYHSTSFKGCSCALMWTSSADIPLPAAGWLRVPVFKSVRPNGTSAAPPLIFRRAWNKYNYSRI